MNQVKYQDIRKDFDLNMFSGLGTPLHDAVRVGNLDTVQWLVEHGANPLVKDTLLQTPLQLARDLGMTEIVAFLEPRSVDNTSPQHDFVDDLGNHILSKEERRENFLQYMKEHEPGVPIHFIEEGNLEKMPATAQSVDSKV